MADADGGNPLCFERDYTYEQCCDTRLGPKGDEVCWDARMDYDFCCKPPAPLPKRHPRCWIGVLQNMHQHCCMGSRESTFNGPRGNIGCWSMAALHGETDLDATTCCEFVSA